MKHSDTNSVKKAYDLDLEEYYRTVLPSLLPFGRELVLITRTRTELAGRGRAARTISPWSYVRSYEKFRQDIAGTVRALVGYVLDQNASDRIIDLSTVLVDFHPSDPSGATLRAYRLNPSFLL